MLTMHPFVDIVRCVSVPEGTLPPLVPGVHAVDELPDLTPIEILPMGGNELPDDELNFVAAEPPPKTVLDEDGNIDPDLLYDQVPIENVMDVDEADVTGLNEGVENYSSAIKQSLLGIGAGAVLAYDNASAYTEAMLSDQFGIDASVERGVTEAIGAVMDLDLVCLFASKANNIPGSVLETFLTKFARETAVKTSDLIQRKTNSARYSDMLAKVHSRVRSSQNHGTEPHSEGPLGADDSRSGLGAIRSRR